MKVIRFMVALLAGAACALGVSVAKGGTGDPALTAPSPGIDQKVLVVTDGTQWVEAILQKLAVEGVPTAVVDLSDAGRPFITADFLADTVAGNPHAKFDRVVLPNNSPADLSTAEKDALASFERSFRVHQVTGQAADAIGSDSRRGDIGKCASSQGECQARAPSSAPTPTPTSLPARPCQPDGKLVSPTVRPTPAPTPAAPVPTPPSTPVTGSPSCGPDGTAGVLPITPSTCTVNATSASQVNSARAGETICFSGSILAGTPLSVTASGTGSAPIIITGDGDTAVKGIRVNASNVVVQGFSVIGAAAPGVQLKGNNLTLQDTKIDHPTGGDYDGIRYFGDGIKILHNQISNITNTHGAHADCMQTFATTTPTSRNVLISGNRCEKIDNQCLIAQGPNSAAGNGSGKGESSGLVFSNNYCDAHASQAVHVDDVQNVTMTSNDIQGRVQKAFNFINHSTGIKISCNRLGSGVGKEAITDGTSRTAG